MENLEYSIKNALENINLSPSLIEYLEIVLEIIEKDKEAIEKENIDEVSGPPTKIRWDSIVLDVKDILEASCPDFIKNNKIRYRYSQDPENYHHILIINNEYIAFTPNVNGKYSMEDFIEFKKLNDYL